MGQATTIVIGRQYFESEYLTQKYDRLKSDYISENIHIDLDEFLIEHKENLGNNSIGTIRQVNIYNRIN